MTVKALYPASSSSLMLDAKRLKRLPSTYTFTRSSTATYIDKLGVLQTAAINQPRFDHSPTTIGKRLGLLIEESRTNSIRNNTMVGAVAGTPGTLPTNWSLSAGGIGTLTQQVVGTGTSNGIAYVDIRYSGTSSNTGVRIFTEAPGNTVASSGQTWTASAYVAILVGSNGLTSLTSDVLERNGAGSIIQTTTGSAFSTVSSALTRLTTTRTLTDATTASVQQAITLSWSNASSVDFTLRIGLPQLEQGAFATSVIPTTGATATRSADVCTVTGVNFSRWYRVDEGTVYAGSKTLPAFGGVNQFPRIACISDGTTSNLIETYSRVVSGVTDSGYLVTAGGATQAAHDTVQATGLLPAAVAYAANNFCYAAGGITQNIDLSGTVPTVSQMAIGFRVASANIMNGTISRLTYWPRRLDNSALQNLTKT